MEPNSEMLLTLQQALKCKHIPPGLYNTYNTIPSTDPDLLRLSDRLTSLSQKSQNGKVKDLGQYFQVTQRDSRGIASMLGCGIADALGASTEFIPFVKDRHHLVKEGFKEIPKKIADGMLSNRGKVGVWTDDCSMALCLADSILANNFIFDPIDLRYRFMLWLDFGLNNGGRPYSIGLGGNISISMHEFETEQKPYADQGDRFNNGNGSLMRLCPAAIGYADNLESAMDVADKQSKTTHNGEQASQCCKLLAKIIVDQINREAGKDAKSCLLQSCGSFKSEVKAVQFLSRSQAESDELFKQLSQQNPKFIKFNKNPKRDRNWNWKDPEFTYSSFRTKSQPGYIGSYCMDALAMALHIVYQTSTFKEAVLWAVNMGGDSDSVGSIVGQITGAMYGLDHELMELYLEMQDCKSKRYHLFLKGHKLITKCGVPVRAEPEDKGAQSPLPEQKKESDIPST